MSWRCAATRFRSSMKAPGEPRGRWITNASSALVDKAGHRHFMAKEIHEQPEAVIGTIRLRHYGSRCGGSDRSNSTMRSSLAKTLATRRRAWRRSSACGTRVHTRPQIGKYLRSRQLARLPVEIRFRFGASLSRPVLYPARMARRCSSAIGRDGQDTLAALRDAKANGQTTLALVNVVESSIRRATPTLWLPIFMRRAPEIGVASTKSLHLLSSRRRPALAIAAGRARGTLSAEDEKKLCTALPEIHACQHRRDSLKTGGDQDRTASARSRAKSARRLLSSLAAELHRSRWKAR